jgi:hypothetical protein
VGSISTSRKPFFSTWLLARDIVSVIILFFFEGGQYYNHHLHKNK